MENTTRRVKFRTIAAAAAMVLLSVGDCAAAGRAGATTTPANVGPSFDCAKATQQAEKLVCDNSELSAMDHELQRAYMAALAHVEPSSTAALKKEQRNWIRYVRNNCETSGCLRDAYSSRIALLEQNERVIYDEGFDCSAFDVGGGCGGVVIHRDPTVHIVEFNKSMRENDRQGKIIGCHKLVEVAIGFANSEIAFGAYCTVENESVRKHVIICNDNMVGNFTIRDVTDVEESTSRLVHFTDDMCFGG